ncbi:MAG: hypothetical protein K5839_04755 [Treponemataceae bacterium]|nr:hypothetical protein [Treponemataceae bacterium]
MAHSYVSFAIYFGNEEKKFNEEMASQAASYLNEKYSDWKKQGFQVSISPELKGKIYTEYPENSENKGFVFKGKIEELDLMIKDLIETFEPEFARGWLILDHTEKDLESSYFSIMAKKEADGNYQGDNFLLYEYDFVFDYDLKYIVEHSSSHCYLRENDEFQKAIKVPIKALITNGSETEVLIENLNLEVKKDKEQKYLAVYAERENFQGYIPLCDKEGKKILDINLFHSFIYPSENGVQEYDENKITDQEKIAVKLLDKAYDNLVEKYSEKGKIYDSLDKNRLAVFDFAQFKKILSKACLCVNMTNTKSLYDFASYIDIVIEDGKVRVLCSDGKRAFKGFLPIKNPDTHLVYFTLNNKFASFLLSLEGNEISFGVERETNILCCKLDDRCYGIQMESCTIPDIDRLLFEEFVPYFKFKVSDLKKAFADYIKKIDRFIYGKGRCQEILNSDKYDNLAYFINPIYDRNYYSKNVSKLYYIDDSLLYFTRLVSNSLSNPDFILTQKILEQDLSESQISSVTRSLLDSIFAEAKYDNGNVIISYQGLDSLTFFDNAKDCLNFDKISIPVENINGERFNQKVGMGFFLKNILPLGLTNESVVLSYNFDRNSWLLEGDDFKEIFLTPNL